MILLTARLLRAIAGWRARRGARRAMLECMREAKVDIQVGKWYVVDVHWPCQVQALPDPPHNTRVAVFAPNGHLYHVPVRNVLRAFTPQDFQKFTATLTTAGSCRDISYLLANYPQSDPT